MVVRYKVQRGVEIVSESVGMNLTDNLDFTVNSYAPATLSKSELSQGSTGPSLGRM